MALSPLFNIYDPSGSLRQRAAMGLLPDDEEEYGLVDMRGRRPQLADLMPPEEKQTLLGTLANVGASGLSGFGWLLDTPGSVVRGLLSGGPQKALSALWETDDDRVSGRELARQYGLTGKQDTWSSFFGGLATEMLLDPLTYATLGTAQLGKGALSQTGKAMKAAGLLRDAAVDSATRVNPLRVASGLAEHADDIPTPRVREYMRRVTPEDALGYITDPTAQQAARDRLLQQFTRYGVDPALGMRSPAAVLDNVRIPGTNLGFEVGGGWLGDSLAQGFDRLGDWTKRAPGIGHVTRTAAAMFDPAVGDLGTVGNDLDLTNQMQFAKRQAAVRARDNAEQVRGLYTQLQLDAANAKVPAAVTSGPLAGQAIPDELRSFESQRLWNALNDYAESRPAQYDIATRAPIGKSSGDPLADWVMENVPEFQSIRDRYVNMGPEAVANARAAGLPTPVASSSNVGGFIPRQLRWWQSAQTPNIPGAAPRVERPWARDQRAFSVADNFGRSRDEAYDLPGGVRAFRYLTGNIDPSVINSRKLQDDLIGADDAGARTLIDQAMQKLAGKDYAAFAGPTGSALPYQHLVDDLLNSPAFASASAATQTAMRSKLDSRIAGNYKRLANVLRTADRQFADNGIGIFDTPSWNNVLRYELGQATNRAGADTLFEQLARNAHNTPAPSIAGGAHVGLDEAASRLGFDPDNFSARWAAEMGGDPADFSISNRQLEALKALIPQSQLATPERGVLGAVDAFQNAWKQGALASPAFHVRNAYSGAINSATQGAFNPLDFLAAWRAGQGNPEALGQRLLNAPGYTGSAAERGRQFLIQTGRQRVATGNVLEDIASNPLMQNSGDAGSVRGLYTGSGTEPTVAQAARELLLGKKGRGWKQFAKDFFSLRGVGILGDAPARNTNPLMVLNDSVGQAVEDALRTGTFLNQVRKGVAPEVAGDLTRLLQLDYSPQAYTSFERNVLKRIAPFYGFQKQILGSIADNMLYRPGGLQGQGIRAVNRGSAPGPDNFVPEYLRQSASIPLPAGLGGNPAEGLQRYLTNLDLPWESSLQLLTPGIGGTAAARVADTIAKTGSNLLGQTSPLIKAPIEHITNRQLYSGRNLSDLYSVLEQDIGPFGRPLEQGIVNFLPFGARGLGLYRQLTDDRLDPSEARMKAAFNLLAGVKLTDVDSDRTRRLAARQVLNQILETTPGVRTYENITVPDDVLRNMPEEQRRMYLLYRVIQSEAAKRARDKKKAETAVDPMQMLGVVNQL